MTDHALCRRLSAALLTALIVISGQLAGAVPLTDGSGPGGVERTDVASTLRVWLAAGDLSLADGADLSTWSNRAIYVGAASAATVANTAPTFENGGSDLRNGNPVVDFSGQASTSVGDVMSGTGVITAEKTLFIVARLEQIDAGCCLGGITANNFNGLVGSGAPGGDWTTDFSGAGSASAPGKLGQWVLVTGHYDNTNNPRTAVFIDGGSTVYSNSVSTNQGTAATGYRLGSRTNNGDNLGRFFDGQIAEAGIFNGVLNTVQRRLVENYLAAKYDITIATPLNDLYEGDLAGKGNYDYDVIGIGSDGTNSHLNSGYRGFGMEATSLDNGDWLLAGHDNTAHGVVDLEGPPVLHGERWDRVYYLDKTGALDATLGFDFDDAGLTSPTSGSFHLLFSEDGNFSDGWQVLAETNSIANGLVTFALTNALLSDGYYTLGINLFLVPEPNSALVCGMLLAGGWLRRRRRAAAGRAAN